MGERRTRGRASRVEQLPEEILQLVHQMLQERGFSQREVLECLNAKLLERGEQPVSRSSLNRYATSMETMGARIREAREVADQWIKRLGTSPTGEVGEILIEMLRTLAFDLTLKMANGEETVEPKFIKELAIGIERLEKAATESYKRAEEIHKRALEKAAEAVEVVAKRGGLSADTVQTLRREILGIAQ